MQAARHGKNYATSGIAAHPCKKRKDGAATFHYGKGRTEPWGRVGQPPGNENISILCNFEQTLDCQCRHAMSGRLRGRLFSEHPNSKECGAFCLGRRSARINQVTAVNIDQ